MTQGQEDFPSSLFSPSTPYSPLIFSNSAASSSFRMDLSFIPIFVILALFFSYISPPAPRTLAYYLNPWGVGKQQSWGAPSLTTGIKVPLEIHIMSKCPDAKDCLEQLIAPALEEIESLVDFRMSFIGRYFFSLSFSSVITNHCF